MRARVRDLDLPSIGMLHLPIEGYIRVSRVGDRAGESSISPEIQRRAIEAWATERGLEVAIQEPEENVSGGTMDRPVFSGIMDRIRAGQSYTDGRVRPKRSGDNRWANLREYRRVTKSGAIWLTEQGPVFAYPNEYYKNAAGLNFGDAAGALKTSCFVNDVWRLHRRIKIFSYYQMRGGQIRYKSPATTEWDSGLEWANGDLRTQTYNAYRNRPASGQTPPAGNDNCPNDQDYP